MDDFENECREQFAKWCELVHQSPYHSLKRKYAEKAYEVIDAYLDWRDVHSL